MARHYGGHPFEKRYACLTDLQLVVLYRQAFLDKEEELEFNFKQYIRPVSSAWSDQFKDLAEMISMFTDPKMFSKYQELIEQKSFEKEAEEEDLESVLFDTLKAVPQTYEVETEEDIASQTLSSKDEEFNDFVAGWVDDKESLFKLLRGD